MVTLEFWFYSADILYTILIKNWEKKLPQQKGEMLVEIFGYASLKI